MMEVESSMMKISGLEASAAALALGPIDKLGNYRASRDTVLRSIEGSASSAVLRKFALQSS